MKFLNNRYASVYNYKGFDICTLKVACPAEGDELGFRIDSALFDGRVFNDVANAINAINAIDSSN